MSGIEPNSSLPLLLAKATQTALAGSENRPYYVLRIYIEKESTARKLT
jgi:hypothetical protein